MIVVVLETADENIRGLLARWLLELKPGTFAGQVSARIRDFIWSEICRNQDKFNGAVLLYPANTEQGFDFDITGTPKRTVIEKEGIKLIKILSDDDSSESKTPTTLFEE